MEKKIVDLATLTPEQLLQEFADRFLAYNESSTKLFLWQTENNYSPEEEFNEEYADLKMECDEDWVRCRECVRFIKKDDELLWC